jgi:hypothetical protein
MAERGLRGEKSGREKRGRSFELSHPFAKNAKGWGTGFVLGRVRGVEVFTVPHLENEMWSTRL